METVFKKIVLLLLIIGSNPLLYASDFSNVLLKKKKPKKETNQLLGIGWGAFLSIGTNGDYTYYDMDTNAVYYARTRQVTAFDLLFLGVQYYYTFARINKEKSFSVHTFPTIGLNFRVDDQLGIGGMQIPIFVNYNIGAGASVKSKKDFGYTFGLGAEFINTSLFYSNENSGYAQYHSSYCQRKSIVQPAINIGYRYFNSNDKLHEWNIKLGAMPRTTADKFGNTSHNTSNLPSLWGRVSFTYFIN
jgi:hypothetical protein